MCPVGYELNEELLCEEVELEWRNLVEVWDTCLFSYRGECYICETSDYDINT